MLPTARELDLLGARAWPALEQIAVGDWRLRFSGGVTKRANSVLPLGDGPPPRDGDLTARLHEVEREYAERGLPARFQVTASTWPPGLGRTLAARGYVESDATVVMTARRRASSAGAWGIVARPEPSRSWFDTWWSVDGRGGDAEADIASRILAAIAPERVFVECRDDEGTAAVALGVVDGGWIGVYCMATLPRARRRGCARALLDHLLARGREQAHLSVTEENHAALSLYRTAGFEPRQRYSYFTLPPATA